MGRDNQPRERQKRDLARKKGNRAKYDRLLIVSEGSKTEPNYFGEIRAQLRLHSANVVVQPSDWGTAPDQVVRYARSLFENGDAARQVQPRAFEKVFAVFDRDDHDTYYQALDMAQSWNKRLKNIDNKLIEFHAIASVPCFELWLLLHFEEIRAPIGRDEVYQRLRRHLPDYDKGRVGAYAETRERIDQARARATALAERFSPFTEPEPYTGIVELVDNLLALGGSHR